jgi:hypothetical protein
VSLVHDLSRVLKLLLLLSDFLGYVLQVYITKERDSQTMDTTAITLHTHTQRAQRRDSQTIDAKLN